MRALAISDTHFGAWTGDDLLRHDFALEALAPQLDDVDELVVLGDLFDFLFSTVDHAFAQADPFFALVRERMQGRRVMFLAGNHDHHIMVHELRTAVELRIATGKMGAALRDEFCAHHRGFFQRFLDRRLYGVETEIAYPHYRVGDALLFHGHYLDAHMTGSLPDRLLNRAIWKIAGGRPAEMLTIEDYEAVIVPLTELLFTVAQLPRGTAAQRTFYGQLQKVGRLISLAGAAGRGARRGRARVGAAAHALRQLGGEVARARARRGALSRDEQIIAEACARGESPVRFGQRAHDSQHVDMALVSACPPTMPPARALEAYGQVVRNLGWDRLTDTLVFAHTHQPLAGVSDRPGSELRFWNTGSWIYEPPHGSEEEFRAYCRRAWPGTGVVIDTEAPSPVLVEMLAEHNPVRQAATTPSPNGAGAVGPRTSPPREPARSSG